MTMDQDQLNKKLLEAIETLGHEDVYDYLVMGADVNCKDEFGVSALEAAIERCDFDMVNLLITYCADLSLKGESGYLPHELAKMFYVANKDPQQAKIYEFLNAKYESL